MNKIAIITYRKNSYFDKKIKDIEEDINHVFYTEGKGFFERLTILIRYKNHFNTIIVNEDLLIALSLGLIKHILRIRVILLWPKIKNNLKLRLAIKLVDFVAIHTHNSPLPESRNIQVIGMNIKRAIELCNAKKVNTINFFAKNIYRYLINLTYAKSLNNNGIILMYHSIGYNIPYFNVSLNNFRWQIDKSISLGFKIVGIEEMMNIRNSGGSLKGLMAITFDDGFKDIIPAIKYMNSLGLKPDIFELGGNIKNLKNSSGVTLDLLTEKDKIDVKASYHSHTMTHRTLTEISTEEVKKELIKSKNLFDSIHFAYPKGKNSPSIVKAVRKTGYKYAYTVKCGSVNNSKSSLLINRVSIDSSVMRFGFRSLLGRCIDNKNFK